MNTNEIADRLDNLCQGLWFSSESDFPLEPFILIDTPPDFEAILAGLGISIDCPIKAIDLAGVTRI